MPQGGAGRVLVRRELDGAPGEFGGAGRGAGLAGEFGRPGTEPGQVEAGLGGRVGDIGPERERPLQVGGRLGQAEHGLRLARRLDRSGQRLRGPARGRPVRGELGGRGGRGAGQLPGQAGVQVFALAGQDRGVDGFGQQRVAEPEGARGLVGDQDFVLDGLAQTVAHVGFGDRGERAEQRVTDVAPGRGGQPQQALGRGVEPGDALQQQVAQAARQRAGVAGGEELFGEEGVAFGAGHDGVGQRGRECGGQGRAGGEQRDQLSGRERAEVEYEARARAPHAVGQPGHAFFRGGLVGAVGREQQDGTFGQVVGEEDDKVER